MSLEEEIEAARQELGQLQEHNSGIEKEMQAHMKALTKEHEELMEAVQARMELIEMIKTDIMQLAFREAMRVQALENKRGAVKK